VGTPRHDTCHFSYEPTPAIVQTDMLGPPLYLPTYTIPEIKIQNTKLVNSPVLPFPFLNQREKKTDFQFPILLHHHIQQFPLSNYQEKEKLQFTPKDNHFPFHSFVLSHCTIPQSKKKKNRKY